LGYGDLSRMDKESEAVMSEIGRDIDPYGRLASSIAPEIFGHDDVKKAMLLQLVGGATRYETVGQ
jgi:DNA replication licensing factor MCM7